MPRGAQFTDEQRSWLCLEFYKRRDRDKKKQFIPQLLRDFQLEFPGVRDPTPKTVRNILKGFVETGTVRNRNSKASPGGNSGRRRNHNAAILFAQREKLKIKIRT